MAYRNKKLNLYMDGTLHGAIKRQAAYEDVPMNVVARRAVEDYLRVQYAKRNEIYPGQQRMTLQPAAESIPGNE